VTRGLHGDYPGSLVFRVATNLSLGWTFGDR